MIEMRARGGPANFLAAIADEDWKALTLSSNSQKELDLEQDAQKRAALLHKWIVGAMNARMAARANVTREQLIETFNELHGDLQRAMADLPPEDFYRRLWREHMLRHGEKKLPWMGPGGDKPPGPPGPPEFGERRRGPPRDDGDRRGDRGKHDDGRDGRNDDRRDKDRSERDRND